MKLKNVFLMGSMAVMGIAFTSCSKDLSYDYEAADNKVKAEYEANFVKKYGEINPNQTWDFATMRPTVSLGASVSAAPTRGTVAGDPKMTKGSDIIIEGSVIDWVTDNLKAGDNNYVKGSPFYMEVPNNKFHIVPIFQGQASYYWQLCMHVDDEEINDIVIWEKNDILFKNSESETEYQTPTNDGMTHKKTESVYEVKSHTYTFENYPKEATMYFYLRVWDNDSKYENWKKNPNNKSWAPRILTSLDYQMLALKGLQVPEALKAEGYTEENVTFIGCEDTEITKTADRDYEDLVFMMYGKPVPPIKHVDEETISSGKRYMMEDLGATGDFDFNDIVVDVVQEYKVQNYYYIYPNGQKKFDHQEIVEGSLKQVAVIRAMGGTRDFTLTIGNTSWTKSENGFDKKEMLNTGLDGEIKENAVLAKFDVTGWVPDDNNISLSVERQGTSKGFYTIAFPKKGKAPMIIATDITPILPWMFEKESVPTDWFTE